MSSNPIDNRTRLSSRSRQYTSSQTSQAPSVALSSSRSRSSNLREALPTFSQRQSEQGTNPTRVSSAGLTSAHAEVFGLLSPWAAGAESSELRRSFAGFSSVLTDTGVANTAAGRSFLAALNPAQTQKLQQSTHSRNSKFAASLLSNKKDPSHDTVLSMLPDYASGKSMSDLRSRHPGFAHYLTDAGFVSETLSGKNFWDALSKRERREVNTAIKSRRQHWREEYGIGSSSSQAPQQVAPTVTAPSLSTRSHRSPSLPPKSPPKTPPSIEPSNFRAAIEALTMPEHIQSASDVVRYPGLESSNHSASCLQSAQGHDGTTRFSLTSQGEQYLPKQFTPGEWRNLESIVASPSVSALSPSVASPGASARTRRSPTIPPSNFKDAIESLTMPEHIKDANDVALYAGIESSDRLATYLQSSQGRDGATQFSLTAKGKRYIEKQFSPSEQDRLTSIVNAHIATTQPYGTPDIPVSNFRAAIESLTMPEHIQSTSDVALYAGIENPDRLAPYLQSSQRPDGSTQFGLTPQGEQYLQQQFTPQERQSLKSIVASLQSAASPSASVRSPSVASPNASARTRRSPSIPPSNFKDAIESLTMPEHIKDRSDAALYANITPEDRLAPYLESSQRPDGSTQFSLTAKGSRYLQRHFSQGEQDELKSIVNSRR